jgi:hypothetical protein
VANLLVAVTFLSLTNALGHATVFWIYGALTVAAILFTYVAVPETKGKTLEQIQQVWRTGRYGRQAGAMPAPTPPAPTPTA